METSPVNRRAIGLLVLVFLLGIGLGVVGTRVVSARAFAARATTPAPTQVHGVARLTQELNLTSDQQKQVGDILANMQSRYNQVRQQATPQYEQIRSEGHDQIRQVLTAEQRPKFEAFLVRVDQERKARDAQNNQK